MEQSQQGILTDLQEISPNAWARNVYVRAHIFRCLLILMKSTLSIILENRSKRKHVRNWPPLPKEIEQAWRLNKNSYWKRWTGNETEESLQPWRERPEDSAETAEIPDTIFTIRVWQTVSKINNPNLFKMYFNAHRRPKKCQQKLTEARPTSRRR